MGQACPTGSTTLSPARPGAPEDTAFPRRSSLAPQSRRRRAPPARSHNHACHDGGMPVADEYRKLSFWHETVPGTLEPGDPLAGDLDADVAIAGAGYTGLWTAYYLSRADPGLKIAVCERDIAGFGASGRNGGWCSALFPASLGKLERMSGRDAAIAMYRAMQATVDEVRRVATAEGIDCHWAKGGTVQLARSATQIERARDEVAEARSV